MEALFDRDALDDLLLDKFRGDIPNIKAAWKILRHWMLGEEIFQLLMERGWLADAREGHATWVFRDGGRMTLYPDGAWETEDGVLRQGLEGTHPGAGARVARPLSVAWRSADSV